MCSTKGSRSCLVSLSCKSKRLSSKAKARTQTQAKDATNTMMKMAEKMHTTPITRENTSAIFQGGLDSFSTTLSFFYNGNGVATLLWPLHSSPKIERIKKTLGDPEKTCGNIWKKELMMLPQLPLGLLHNNSFYLNSRDPKEQKRRSCPYSPLNGDL